MMSINLNDTSILNTRDVDYYCIIKGKSKSDSVSLLQNADLTEWRRILQK